MCNKIYKRNIILIFSMLLLALCLVACKPNPKNKTKYSDVTFRFGSAAFSEGNISSYRIQYRSIPLFGNNETAGRHINWTDVLEEDPNSGTFNLRGIECGEWIFYVRVSDEVSTFIDICTGTVVVDRDFTITINETDSNLIGYGKQDIYIRTDYVYERQGISIVYENTATGRTFEVPQSDMKVAKTGKMTIDYFCSTGEIPCADYVVTVKIYGQGGTVIMSGEQTVQIRSTGTDTLIMRLRSESGAGGNLVIGGNDILEGIILGQEIGYIEEPVEYKFVPLSEYTVENAVWYYWYADGKRYSTREPIVHITFPYPGQYVVSCTAIGINGEVMRDGVSTTKTMIEEMR